MTKTDTIQIREAPDVSPKWKRIIIVGHGKEMGFEIPMDEWKGMVPREMIYASARRVFLKAITENAPALRLRSESLPDE